tara:strand:- start:1014 stop:1139 length:126 start_codon:yes stop_codon:yes gene_type:complete
MEQKDKIQSLLDRIEELEQQVMDLRMAFITALDLIETYKEA